MDQGKGHLYQSDQELMEHLDRYREVAKSILLLDLPSWKVMLRTHWLSRAQSGDQLIVTMIRSDDIQNAIAGWASMIPEAVLGEVSLALQAVVMVRAQARLETLSPQERVLEMKNAREFVEAQLSRLDQQLASSALLQ